MKIIMTFILVLISNLIIGQKLPNLNLLTSIESKQQINSPIVLNKDEICVTLVEGVGMSGFDYYTHYVFQKDGNIQTFKEEVPKKYLKKLKKTLTKIEIDELTKRKLWNNLNSPFSIEFTKFSQKDFYNPIKTNSIQSPCISDALGYSISFIQNNEQKIYSFYAPEYYLSGRCKDENINLKTLEEFTNLLKHWGVI